jgi:hypothetical protein
MLGSRGVGTDLMNRSYRGRNVDLSLLAQWIERFFKKKEFRVARETAEETCNIVVRPTYAHDIVDTTTVSIVGDANDFTVKLYIGTRSEVLMKIGQLASLFGLGVLFLRGIKSNEAEEALQREFWVFVEEKVDRLANSANSTI